MSDLEARVARLEALFAQSPPHAALPSPAAPEAPSPVPPTVPPTAPSAPPAPVEDRPARGDSPALHAWIDHQLQGNTVFVFAGVARPGARATASRGWSVAGDVTINVRRAAATCSALSSEQRLSMLQELMRGPRTTAELMEALGFDRGQLYHHLRDLFVQAMVEQPERGRYALTARGAWTYLLAGLLAGDAPVAAEIPEDEGGI